MLQTLQTRFYTDWDFYRRVLAITLPIAIQNVLNLGVNMMDIIMLGQLGDTAIAAANLGGQPFIILNVTGFGLASGAAVLIAQYWGKRDMLRIRQIFALSLRFALGASALFTVLGRLFPESRRDASLSGALSGNICANLLGLGNAATPMGIAAAKRLIDPARPKVAGDSLCRLIEKRIAREESYIDEDIAFHTCIAECSGNIVVKQLIPIIDTAVLMFVNVTHRRLTKETIQTHRAITDAIAEHDSIGAKTAMLMHMIYNRDMIKQLIKEQEAPALTHPNHRDKAKDI